MSNVALQESDVKELNAQEISVPNIMALTARLAQILAEEADLLAEMKVKAIEPLQKEKVWLTRAIEIQIKRMRQQPQLLADLDEDELEEMRELADIFDDVMQENHRRLLSAKQVNERIVEAITDVVNDETKKGTYNVVGNPDYKKESFSVTLNKQV